jgi:heme/copper-type cytochrome/quinol oxidase subunit 2
VPIAIGVLISLTVHGAKASVRPVVNTTTAGFGAPVVSTIEDLGSVTLSLVAILIPVLVLVLLIALVAWFWALRRRRRRRRAAKRTARPEPGTTKI